MIRRSKTSRRQLEFHIFEETESHNWRIVIPKYYAYLFELEEPDILEKSNTGWRVSKNPRLMYAFFKGLTQDEIVRIESFLSDYESWIVLDLNEHIENAFSDELDFCLALSWPAENPKELTKNNRSHIGKLVYQAKYKRRVDKADELAVYLGNGVKRIVRGKVNNKVCISFIPSDSYKKFYVPKYLVEKLLGDDSITQLLDSGNPYIKAEITSKLRKIKNISIKAKLSVCRDIYAGSKVSLANSVVGCDIIVVDDLYQSGTTMWSYAKFLKDNGAARVLGLACEKNFRDSDNK